MSLQEQIRANRVRSAFVILGILALLIGVLAAAIWFAFDPSIGILLAIIGIGYGVFSYLGAGRLVASVAHAHPVTKEEQPELVRAVENVAIAAGLDRTPPVYLIEDDAPNAFAAGRKPADAYVAATTGLVALMDRRELEGVMAHEISHIRNRDVRLMTLAAVLVGVIALMADLLFRISLFGGSRRDNREGGNPIGLDHRHRGARAGADLGGTAADVALAPPRVSRGCLGCRDHGRSRGPRTRAGQARQRQARRSST